MTTLIVGCPSIRRRGELVPAWLLTNHRDDRWTKAAKTAAWRETAGWQARADRVPAFDVPVRITATPYWSGRQIPDVDAFALTVKAAVDGLVDAKVLPDDGPKWWPVVTYRAAVKATDLDRLELTIEPLDPAEAHTSAAHGRSDAPTTSDSPGTTRGAQNAVQRIDGLHRSIDTQDD